MKPIQIKAPARLHFGLIDMNGELGRIDGGIGLALETPFTLIEAHPCEQLRVEYDDEPKNVQRMVTALGRVCDEYDLPGAFVHVQKRPRPHVGMGSATQILVGAAKAVCLLYGLDKPARELAGLVGRGGTSGIGIGVIESGGFVLDGGHRFRRGENSKQGYSPSSASVGNEAPPIVAHYDFPDWDILLVTPQSDEGASGSLELNLFEEFCPIPLNEVQQECHILLMQMLPAILEADLEMFGQAMEEFQTLGFKALEIRTQTQRVRDCMHFLKQNGGIGVGMSSWGPTVYAFGTDLSALHHQADGWLEEHGGGETLLTKANNIGMQIINPE